MHIVVITLTVIIALLLIGIVLIQKSKGGGLSSQFGGAGSVMGVRQTNSFLEKATWTLLGLLILLSIISAFTMPKVSNETRLRTIAPEAAAPAQLPAGQFDTPVAAPVAVEGEAAAVAVEEVPAAEATEAAAE